MKNSTYRKMLTHLLTQESYVLSITPGFFRFYAEIGVLEALEEAGCLRASHITGSSAGALVGAFYASGMKPKDMETNVLAIKREDVWDVGGIGGLLKGKQFEELIAKNLPVQTFEECNIPLAVTAFDVGRLKTRILTSGNVALAARTSCTFPGLFQPSIIEGTPHIDGGVWDHVGMMGLDECFKVGNQRRLASGLPEEDFTNKLIVNIVFDTARGSYLPKNLSKCRLLTLVVENIPGVSPFTMNTMGPIALKKARAAMRKSLHSAHMQEYSLNHWICYVDGALVKDEELDLVEPPRPFPLQRIASDNNIESGDVTADPTPRLTISSKNNTNNAVLPAASSMQTLPISEASQNNSQVNSASSSSHGLDIVSNSHSESAHLVNSGEQVNGITTTTTGILVESEDQQTIIHPSSLSSSSSSAMKPSTDETKEGNEEITEKIYEKDFELLPTLPENFKELVEASASSTLTGEKKEATTTEGKNRVTFQSNEEKECSNESNEKADDTISDFIQIPSFSFINGTYYLYQKMSTTLNSSMASASETSNQFINAVTSTIQTTFSPSGMKTVTTTKSTTTVYHPENDDEEIKEETKMVIVDEADNQHEEQTISTTSVHHEHRHPANQITGMKRGHEEEESSTVSVAEISQNTDKLISPNKKRSKVESI